MDDEESTSSIRDALDEDRDLRGEAAGGVVRGVSRSLVRGPLIGRLPAKAPTPSVGSSSTALLRKRIPARQVARVSDRVATGMDWYASAVEAHEPERAKTSLTKKEWILKARSFGWNLFRNTILGMAVFESYGYVVSSLAPDDADDATVSGLTSDLKPHTEEVIVAPQLYGGAVEEDYDDHVDDDDDDDRSTVFVEPDEYSRASLPSHFVAGSAAGSVHGIASSLMEGNPTSRPMMRYFAWNTVHHSVAHSMLFGSYEGIKRGLLHITENEERTRTSRAYHLVTFSIAGGLAGQIQHLMSHYVEGGLGLANETLQVEWRVALRTLPALRPLMWAFPPSAIGFVAFEYGKQLAS